MDGPLPAPVFLTITGSRAVMTGDAAPWYVKATPTAVTLNGMNIALTRHNLSVISHSCCAKALSPKNPVIPFMVQQDVKFPTAARRYVRPILSAVMLNGILSASGGQPPSAPRPHARFRAEDHVLIHQWISGVVIMRAVAKCATQIPAAAAHHGILSASPWQGTCADNNLFYKFLTGD